MRHPGILQRGRIGLFWSRPHSALAADGVTLEILGEYAAIPPRYFPFPQSSGEGSQTESVFSLWFSPLFFH